MRGKGQTACQVDASPVTTGGPGGGQGWRGEGGREAGAVSIYILSKQVDVLQTAHCLPPPPLLPAGLVWAINRSALLPHVHSINLSVSIHLSIELPGRLLSGREVFFFFFLFCLLSPPPPCVCLPPRVFSECLTGCQSNSWNGAAVTRGPLHNKPSGHAPPPPLFAMCTQARSTRRVCMSKT